MTLRDGASGRRTLDAVLLLDKPSGITSNAALQQAKRLLRAAKAGHTGTLDPLASGLLPILFGEATKFAEHLLQADKEYLASIRLGVATTTGDLEGEVLARREAVTDLAQLDNALARFRGEIDQIPPMYSALKHGGEPLYALARRGHTVDRMARRVTIHALERVQLSGALLQLRIRCSKGTYVRALADDLGRQLGCGACVAALRRIGTAGFGVAQAVTLGALAGHGETERDTFLLPVDVLLQNLPKAELDAAAAARFCHGQAVELRPDVPGRHRVYARTGGLLGLGMLTSAGRLEPLRLVAASPAQPAEIARKNL